MTDIAIIGGTGLANLKVLEIVRREVVHTPYGEPSSALTHGRLWDQEVVFMARHGYGHTIPPHRVNYRANLWALHHVGIRRVIAVGAVGGINAALTPGTLAVPDQIIDYTWSRKHSFYEDNLTRVTHIDFTEPYCQVLREALIEAGDAAGLTCYKEGTYGATQGPRLETAQEINRLERDGCDMVGMTGMPEAALAKELGLCYATCAVVANWAAGRGAKTISMQDIDQNLQAGMNSVRKLLKRMVPRL